MGKFAKLIELDNNEQVLLMVVYDDDEDTYKLSMQTEFNDCIAELKLGFNTEEQAKKAMANYKEENAIALREDLAKMF